MDNVEVVAASTRRHPAEGLRIYDHWEKLLLDNEVDLVGDYDAAQSSCRHRGSSDGSG